MKVGTRYYKLIVYLPREEQHYGPPHKKLERILNAAKKKYKKAVKIFLTHGVFEEQPPDESNSGNAIFTEKDRPKTKQYEA